jgi:nucleotide-binding universal stress UspA family protein
MFKDIVVGVDERGGLDAIALATKLVSAGGGMTLALVGRRDSYLAHAIAAAGPDATRSYEEAQRDDALQLLETARDRSLTERPGVDVELRYVLSGSVGRGLHELAEQTGADLIVLGSSRRGVLGRVLLGDDTRAALNGAPASVAVAPAGYRDRGPGIQTIGVGYDGSPESEHALQLARELAAEHHAKLAALTAVAIPTAVFGPGPLPLLDAIDTLVRQAKERIADLGGVEAHAAYGAAAEELAAFSGSLDILVIGSRGYGPIGRLVHGSVSQQLARTARCPLLVLTRAGKSAAETSDSRETREAIKAAS